MAQSVKFGSLVGETLAYIDIDPENAQILLITESGKKFKIYHEQNCCEVVRLVGVDGEATNLVGKVLVEASEEIDHDRRDTIDNDLYYEESYTNTELTFRVDGHTVISRWVGSSNGYYSEGVDIVQLFEGESFDLRHYSYLEDDEDEEEED